jgi:hypothetical protein
MKHKKFNEYESMHCKICAAILLNAIEKANINHKDIVINRAKEVVNELS